MAARQNIQQKKLVNFLEWFGAWGIVLASGNHGKTSFFGDRLGLGMLIKLSFLLLWAIKSDRRFRLPSFVLASAMALWLFYCATQARGATFFNMLIAPSNVICMYLLLSVTNFRIFRERLLTALTYLSAATLITFAIYMLTGIGRGISRGAETQIFYLFRVWGGNRAASIYQEAGQYQIIILFILVLFVDEFVKINFSNIKYYIKKFGIVLGGLLASQSSMGYICLFQLMLITFIFNKSAKRNVLAYMVLAVAGLAAAFLVWNSNVVQDKIAAKNLIVRSSLAERVNDSIMLFRMSLISPLTGLGSNSEEYYRWGDFFGGFPHKNGINGWGNMLACCGWPFFLLLTGSMVLNIKRMKPGAPPLLVFLILLFSQAGENNAMYYSTFLYVFPYDSYEEPGNYL